MGFKSFKLNGLVRQYLAALSASISMATSASCYGWLPTVLSHILHTDSEIPLTHQHIPWIFSLLELGIILSSIPAGCLVNHVGRKPLILMTAPLYMLSWLMIIWFPSVLMFATARVLQGFTMGFVLTVVPIYSGEIASKSSRGAVTSLATYSSYWVGHLVEYSVGHYLSYNNFTYFSLALNVPLLLFFSWQPESPYYLVLAGDEEKARESLQCFRDVSPQELDEEMVEITLNVNASKKTRISKIISSPRDRKAIALLLVLASAKVLGGSSVVGFYSYQIFAETPIPNVSPSVIPFVLGVVMFAGSCVGAFLTDKVGRRRLLSSANIGCLVCQLCTATYLLLSKFSDDPSQLNWIPLVLISLYSALRTANTIHGSYVSELFETQTRGVAAGMSLLTGTVATFVGLIMFPPITRWGGLYTMFYVCSLFIFLGILYTRYNAKETNGKSFNQIRSELEEK